MGHCVSLFSVLLFAQPTTLELSWIPADHLIISLQVRVNSLGCFKI